jgi:hypothetical protein
MYLQLELKGENKEDTGKVHSGIYEYYHYQEMTA